MEVGFRLYYVSFDRGTDLIFLPEKFFLWAHGKKKKKERKQQNRKRHTSKHQYVQEKYKP